MFSKWIKCICLACASFNVHSFETIPPYYFELSASEGVPVEHTFSLALSETNAPLNDGRALPWPFTINLYGKAYLFATQAEMVEFANDLLEQGIELWDIGLYQVNWYWNGKHRVSSPEELADPVRNGEVAMEILKEHFQRTNNWIEAAGRYHNPANKNGLADIYKGKYVVHLENVKNALYQ